MLDERLIKALHVEGSTHEALRRVEHEG